NADISKRDSYRRETSGRGRNRVCLRRLVGDKQCAQTFPESRARRAPRWRCESRHGTLVASADGGHGEGDTFHSGGFAGRDRAGHRRLEWFASKAGTSRLTLFITNGRLRAQPRRRELAAHALRSLLSEEKVMGLSWQQGPLSPGAFGRFLVPDPLPKRLLYAERLRRRMRVRFGGAWIADSEDVLLLFEPGHYPM